IAADAVVRLYPLHDLNRVREPRHPWPSCSLVGEVEAGAWRVLEARLGAKGVLRGDQQVRLTASHQVDIAHGPLRLGRKRRGPHETGRPRPEQVDRVNGRMVVDLRKGDELLRGIPTVPRLVQPDPDAASPEVYDVGDSGAVDVGEAH